MTLARAQASRDDFSVLHCALLLRTIFASSARSHQRLRVQDIRDFPQAELGMEINARFLLNKQDDPHFLLLELKLHRAIYHFSRFEKEFELLLQNSLILML